MIRPMLEILFIMLCVGVFVILPTYAVIKTIREGKNNETTSKN